MERSRPISRAAALPSNLQRQVADVRKQTLQIPVNNAVNAIEKMYISMSQSTMTEGERLNTRKANHLRDSLIHQPQNAFNLKEAMKSAPTLRSSFGQTPYDSRVDSFPNEFSNLSLEQSGVHSHPNFEDSTIHSAETSRSVGTEATEANSLFKTKDDSSIEKYMQEILRLSREGSPIASPQSSPGHARKTLSGLGSMSEPLDVEPPPPSPVPQSSSHHQHHFVEDAEAAMHYDIRCNNLSSWRVSTSSVRVHMLNFKVMEDIIYRESLLQKIQVHLTVIDIKYWKYAVERIRAVEAGRLLHGEGLVAKRNELFVLQHKLAVEVAHLRSLNVSILDNIRRLRVLVREELDAAATVSVFWKETNYILKIRRDSELLTQRATTVRYWFGFSPNPLMIPPDDHRPYQQWRLQTGLLFSQWLATHKEKVVKEKRQTTKHRRGYIIQDTKFLFDNLQLLQDVEKVDLATHAHQTRDVDLTLQAPRSTGGLGQDGSGLLRPGSGMPGSKPPSAGVPGTGAGSGVGVGDEGSGTMFHVVGRVPKSSQVKSFEPWEQLRDYCDYSWGIVKPARLEHMETFGLVNGRVPDYVPSRLYVQAVEAAPFFWNNPNHNPFVVEAAVGFAEVFPQIFVVPPLPVEVRRKCLELHRMMEDELRIQGDLDERKIAAARRKEEFFSHAQLGSLAELGESEVARDALKRRHQADSELLSGVSARYLTERSQSICLPPRAVREEQNPPSPVQVESTVLFAGEHIFSLTFDEAAGGLADSQSLRRSTFGGSLADDDDAAGEGGGWGGGTVSKSKIDAGPAVASLSLVQDVSSMYPVYTLDASASASSVRTAIINKVHDHRRLTRRASEQPTSPTVEPQPSASGTVTATATATVAFAVLDDVDEASSEGGGASTSRSLQEGSRSVKSTGSAFNLLSSSFKRHSSAVLTTSAPLETQRSMKPERKGRRELYRLDPKWQAHHARQIQRVVRGFLARRAVRKLRLKSVWKRTVAKLQGAVRGFVLRMKRKREEEELHMEAFLVRKQAVKRFRAALTVSRLIRKKVNIMRMKKQEPLLLDKLDNFGQPLSRRQGMQRLRASLTAPALADMIQQGLAKLPLLAGESDEEASASTGLAIKPQLPADARRLTRVPVMEHHHGGLSVADSQTTQSQEGFSIMNVDGSVAHDGDDEEDATSGGVGGQGGGDHESECSRSSWDEAQRRAFLNTRAAALVKKVNAGKVLPDSLRDSRLIPIEAASPMKKLHRRPKMSTRERTFLQNPDSVPQSVAASTADVYVPPRSFFGKNLPKGGAPVYKSAEELKRLREDRDDAKFHSTLQKVFR